MDEVIGMVIIAAVPLYALVCGGVFYVFAFGFHMLRRVDESTQKTAITETASTPVNKV